MLSFQRDLQRLGHRRVRPSHELTDLKDHVGIADEQMAFLSKNKKEDK